MRVGVLRGEGLPAAGAEELGEREPGVPAESEPVEGQSCDSGDDAGSEGPDVQ